MKSGKKIITRRELLVCAAACLSLNGLWVLYHQGIPDENNESLEGDLSRGRDFLAGMLDPDLDLLPEYPGSSVYWLYHDNYLAAKVLSLTHPDTSQKISSAMKVEGILSSGKIELLFGELKEPLPFRQYDLIDVRRIGSKTIRTEVIKKDVFSGWQSYADLNLMACIAESRPFEAKKHWDTSMRMWDGKGFADTATKVMHRYSTYKLGLALIACNRVQMKPPRGLADRLRSLQSESGGWVTDYSAEGQKIGLTNVETTCLSILGLEAHNLSIQRQSPKTQNHRA